MVNFFMLNIITHQLFLERCFWLDRCQLYNLVLPELWKRVCIYWYVEVYPKSMYIGANSSALRIVHSRYVKVKYANMVP